MKNKLFQTREEMLDYYIRQLDSKNELVLVVDKEMAKEISYLFDEEDFSDYFGVSYASDTNEYFVELIAEVHFSIEPARHMGKYLQGETKKLIVMSQFLNDELLDATDYEKLVVVDVFEDEEFGENNEEIESCNCNNCGCGCNCEELTEEDNTELFFSDLAQIVEEILDELENKCDCEDCRRDNVRDAILDVVEVVLQGFGIIEDKEED